jgi:predicted aminopeptidase
MRISIKMRGFIVVVLAHLVSGCYTLKQGYQQVRLLSSAKTVSEILANQTETPDRLEKLRWVPKIVNFAENDLRLKVDGNYKKYIALEGSSVTYIVQAAQKRRLEQKNWWFPIVGSQPYLGFFQKKDAENFRKELLEEGFDTSLGGVQAFSLLGYIADPVYSSMLDGNTLPNLAEVLIHELAHATLYVPGRSSFNENFANFVGSKGAFLFLNAHEELRESSQLFWDESRRNDEARKFFGTYLRQVKDTLQKFYREASDNPAMADDAVFLKARQLEFDKISADYLAHMDGREKGTDYERAFAQGRVNNATILGYALYEAHQDVFEKIFERAGNDMVRFVNDVRNCVKQGGTSEAELWNHLETCGERVL